MPRLKLPIKSVSFIGFALGRNTVNLRPQFLSFFVMLILLNYYLIAKIIHLKMFFLNFQDSAGYIYRIILLILNFNVID